MLPEPKPIEHGDVFGDLEVEERAGRNAQGLTLWRCRCRRVVDGEVCRKPVLKTTTQLRSDRVSKACGDCTARGLKEHRRRYYTNAYR